MKIELVKETNHRDTITYYVKVDDKFRSGSVCHSLGEAMEMYDTIKLSLGGKRIEVLMQEEI
jgi:hypothetical protein